MFKSRFFKLGYAEHLYSAARFRAYTNPNPFKRLVAHIYIVWDANLKTIFLLLLFKIKHYR